MEALADVLKVLGSIWIQIQEAPAHLLLILVLNVIGVALKMSPVQNRAIPPLLMLLGMGGYPFLASPANINPAFRHPEVVLALYGLLLGFLAVVAHMLLRRIEKFRDIEAAIVGAFRRE